MKIETNEQVVPQLELDYKKGYDRLTTGINFLFNKNKITRLEGTARIDGAGAVTIVDGKDKGSYKSEKIMIATGSHASSLPGISIDEKHIVSSAGALSLNKCPKKFQQIYLLSLRIENWMTMHTSL